MNKKEYREYLESAGWKKLRAIVIRLHCYRCAVCNSGETLEVHHRTYKQVGNEDIFDLIPMCSTCHGKFHDRLPEKPNEPFDYVTKIRDCDWDECWYEMVGTMPDHFIINNWYIESDSEWFVTIDSYEEINLDLESLSKKCSDKIGIKISIFDICAR